MLSSVYSVLLLIAIAQCSVIFIDDACIKRCAEDLPEARGKAMMICMDLCKQPKRSHQSVDDANDEPKVNSVTSILLFLKDVVNSLIMISKRFPQSEDKNLLTFLELNNLNIDENMRSIFRKKRDAQFAANLRGKAQAGTDSDFRFDSGGLYGNTKALLDYEGTGTGTGQLSAGPLNLQGDWEGDIGGDAELGLHGQLNGLNSGFTGDWTHQGQANLAGKGQASVYGLTIGGAGGRAQAKYSGEGNMIGGIGRGGGLLGIDYDAVNQGSLYGTGAAGIGHPLIGIGAGVQAEGGGTAYSKAKGGAGLMYGPNGFGLGGNTQTQTNLAGGVDLRGGIGAYDKYANEQVWRG